MLGAITIVACSDIDGQDPESGSLTAAQVQATNTAIPERSEATFKGMFSMMADPYGVFGASQGRDDDFGYAMMALSQDAEGADLVMSDNGYNWFSPCCEFTSRNANYANPYIRYTIPYQQIGITQEILGTATDTAQIAQARAMRAFAYMQLAPYFQFSYSVVPDEPCVPLLKEGVDYTNNPRATVREVYEYIMEDLNFAVENLDGYSRAGDKSLIDQNVAYGLRARANLAMGNSADAAADAAKAMQGYTPASISEVSVPSFCSIDEHNWIWGIDLTDDQVKNSTATSSSWICAFSGNGYAPSCQLVPSINVLLYNLIPSTDVRKGWWLDANRHSPNIAGLTWTGISNKVTVTAHGDEICDLVLDDGSKDVFSAYNNVKFAQKSGVGNTLNSNDWPLMRVEEMILIQAEGLAKSGNEGQARSVLSDFVKTYRDPSYTISSKRTLADEIWLQRRIELWGEGFFASDAKRLDKPIVRFHEGKDSNVPDNFKFNITHNDKWLNMRFCTSETNNNAGIVNNTGGSVPTAGQNGSLLDGVTD